MSDASGTVVWFRRDLRLADNPALMWAISRGGPVVPAFVWSPEVDGQWPPGAASKWWLYESLSALAKSLAARGSRLVLRRGPVLEALTQIANECGASAVCWNRLYEPAAVQRDRIVKASLTQSGLLAESFNGGLLYEPWSVSTRDGRPFQVFTAFWRACRGSAEPPHPMPTPDRLPPPQQWPQSLNLQQLELLPNHAWPRKLANHWQPGESSARQRLAEFVQQGMQHYAISRDRPDTAGTSRLSPHLHFGEISVREARQAALKMVVTAKEEKATESAETFLRELGWREFAHHLLFHFPHTTRQPLRAAFASFPWKCNSEQLAAWQRGRTGYPIVDAGMRELWQTGWMHNRVRMIVASFLVKDLLISWNEGAAWFWDTLVDADLANNTLGWQWSAGCGADAAPYFRIFNPVRQAEKFDPNGDYVRRYVTELARLPAPWIHRPWEANAKMLSDAEVELGTTYPQRIVDHAEARRAALDALARSRQ